MEDSNWIDKLFRSKLQERDFEADDASWEDALDLIEKNERSTRFRNWGYGLSSVLVVGLISFFVWNSNTVESQLAENTSDTEGTIQQGETASNANKTYREEGKVNEELGKNESIPQRGSDDATRMDSNNATNGQITTAEEERKGAASSSFNEQASAGSEPSAAASPKADTQNPKSSPQSKSKAASSGGPTKGHKAGSAETRTPGSARVGNTNTQKQHTSSRTNDSKTSNNSGGNTSTKTAGNASETDTQTQQASGNSSGNTPTKPVGNASLTNTQTQQASSSSSDNTPTKPVGNASLTNTQTQQANNSTTGNDPSKPAGNTSATDTQTQQANNNTTDNDPSKPAGNTSETATKSQHASNITTEGAQPSDPGPVATNDSSTEQASATSSAVKGANEENAEPTNGAGENEEEGSNNTPTSPSQNTAATTPPPPASSVPTTVPDSPALADQFMHAKFGANTTSQSISGGNAASIIEDGTSSVITPAIAFEYFRKAGRFHVGSGLHYTSSKIELNIPDRNVITITYEDSIFAALDSVWVLDSNQTGNWVQMQTTDTITLTDSLIARVTGTKTTIIRSHIRIPILFAYRKQYGRLTLGVDVGPTLNILSGQKGVYPTADLSANSPVAMEHFRKLSIGYMLRPSIHYTLSDRLSIGIEPYLYGQFQSNAKVDPLKKQRFSNYGLGFGLVYSLGGGTPVTP